MRPAAAAGPCSPDSSSGAGSAVVVAATCDPPTTVVGIVRSFGPGLIIAGSVVGSGELIATTKTGAEAGISLLWLILIGCVIKVFVQIELGRFAICNGKTTLAALDSVPGPRLRVNGIVWFWVLMFLVGQAQLGAIVGGVGQAISLACPISGDYSRMIAVPSLDELKRYLLWDADHAVGDPGLHQLAETQQRRVVLGQRLVSERLKNAGPPGIDALIAVRELLAAENALTLARAESGADSPQAQAAGQELRAVEARVLAQLNPATHDDRWWATIVTLGTIGLLYRGRYQLMQRVATVLVMSFTFVTVGNVIALQSTPQWRISAAEILYGLSFHLPPPPILPPGTLERLRDPLMTALATFGIIGVGAAELVAYPYWCLEKGYARFTGPRTADPAWGRRARGWMMVMHYDAFACMVLYTVVTVAFLLTGVAVMHTQGLNPDGMRMVGTLLEQYVPVFGAYARWLFLAGAISVLYGTFLVGNASNARMLADVLKVFRLAPGDDPERQAQLVRYCCVLLPASNLALYWTGANPVALILLGGTMQALMLPLLGIAALYFRYRAMDDRLRPGRMWDGLLWISCAGLLIAGVYIGWNQGSKLLGEARALLSIVAS